MSLAYGIVGKLSATHNKQPVMTKLFVRLGGLDRSVSREDRITLLSRIFSPYTEVDPANILIITDKDYGGFRNFCFVSIEDADQAQAAIQGLDGQVDEETGYQINVNEAQPEGERPKNAGGFNRNKSAGSSYGGGSNRSGGGYGNSSRY
jgi:cold-inducible RNA-binding protein